MTIIVMVDHWRVRFSVRRPVPGLPWPRVAAEEVVQAGYGSVGRHRSDDAAAVLQITLAGRGEITQGDEVRSVRPGQALLCRVADARVRYAHPGGARPWHFCFLSFHGANDTVEALLARHGPVLDLGERHPVLAQIIALRRLGATAQMPAGEAALIVQRMLASLVDGIAPVDGPAARLVHDAQDLARAQTVLPTVAGLAGLLSVPRERLSRAFASELGQSPQAWLAVERLERVRHHLLTSDAALDEVAIANGFPSSSHLCRAFARIYGVPPARWRRSARE